jgi:DNA helicase II / ATP-dependent DNA helicase PcrA
MGSVPVLRSFQSEHAEAAFIAVEIKRLVAHTGGMLGWGDFVVLRAYSVAQLEPKVYCRN